MEITSFKFKIGKLYVYKGPSEWSIWKIPFEGSESKSLGKLKSGCVLIYLGKWGGSWNKFIVGNDVGLISAGEPWFREMKCTLGEK